MGIRGGKVSLLRTKEAKKAGTRKINLCTTGGTGRKHSGPKVKGSRNKLGSKVPALSLTKTGARPLKSGHEIHEENVLGEKNPGP